MSDISLSQARIMLLPGVWQKAAIYQAGSGWDLQVDWTNNSLTLVSPKGRTTIVTRKELDDDSFKDSFGPRLDEAMQTKD